MPLFLAIRNPKDASFSRYNHHSKLVSRGDNIVYSTLPDCTTTLICCYYSHLFLPTWWNLISVRYTISAYVDQKCYAAYIMGVIFIS